MPTGGLSPSRMTSRSWLPPPIGFGTAATIVPSCVRSSPTGVGAGVGTLTNVAVAVGSGVKLGVGVDRRGAGRRRRHRARYRDTGQTRVVRDVARLDAVARIVVVAVRVDVAAAGRDRMRAALLRIARVGRAEIGVVTAVLAGVLEERDVARRVGRRDDLVRLVAECPTRARICRASLERLRRRRVQQDARADDLRPHERRDAQLRDPASERQSRRVAGERQIDRFRIEEDARRVGETAGVGRGRAAARGVTGTRARAP